MSAFYGSVRIDNLNLACPPLGTQHQGPQYGPFVAIGSPLLSESPLLFLRLLGGLW